MYNDVFSARACLFLFSFFLAATGFIASTMSSDSLASRRPRAPFRVYTARASTRSSPSNIISSSSSLPPPPPPKKRKLTSASLPKSQAPPSSGNNTDSEYEISRITAEKLIAKYYLCGLVTNCLLPFAEHMVPVELTMTCITCEKTVCFEHRQAGIDKRVECMFCRAINFGWARSTPFERLVIYHKNEDQITRSGRLIKRRVLSERVDLEEESNESDADLATPDEDFGGEASPEHEEINLISSEEEFNLFE